MAKHKQTIKVATICFGIVFVLSILFAYHPWTEIHYGNINPKIVYRDTSLNKKETTKQKTNHPAPLPILKIAYNHVKVDLRQTKKTIPHIPKQDTVRQAPKYNVTNPINSAVGDYASVTNNVYGLHQRIMTDNDLAILYKTYPDKSIRIQFLTWGEPTLEMDSVRNQIAVILRAHGYINVATDGWDMHLDGRAHSKFELFKNPHADGIQIAIPYNH